jgi:chromatin remodeling complex protein RSC6
MAAGKKTPVATTPTPAAVAPAAAAPVAAKASTKAAPKPVAKVADAPAVVVASTEKPADATEKPVDASVDGAALSDVISKFAALTALFKETQTALKTLTKDYERMKKAISKTERKRANARTNPNGFAKPAKITDALCAFLNVPAGTEMSRTDVTRKINLYIKEHNLNKPENKRIIVPDEKLRAILGVKNGDEVSFFSLQRFLSPLFVKKAVVA